MMLLPLLARAAAALTVSFVSSRLPKFSMVCVPNVFNELHEWGGRTRRGQLLGGFTRTR